MVVFCYIAVVYHPFSRNYNVLIFYIFNVDVTWYTEILIRMKNSILQAGTKCLFWKSRIHQFFIFTNTNYSTVLAKIREAREAQTAGGEAALGSVLAEIDAQDTERTIAERKQRELFGVR